MDQALVVNRRRFLNQVVLGLLAPLAAEAQQAEKVWHIGWLDHLGAAQDWQATFVRELRELGYVEGRNFMLDVRHAEGEFDRLPALARDLVRSKVDLIVAFRNPAIHAAAHATRAIPIVMIGSADPMGLGFVASLGAPGGNITGLSELGAELAGKQLDLLRQALPRLARATIFMTTAAGATQLVQRHIRQAARALGVTLRFEQVKNRADVERAFARIGERPDALMVLGRDLLDFAAVVRIGELAQKQKIAVMSDHISLTVAWGGLLYYGASYSPQARRAAHYADKILKGPGPAPSRWSNRRTSHSRSISPPPRPSA